MDLNADEESTKPSLPPITRGAKPSVITHNREIKEVGYEATGAFALSPKGEIRRAYLLGKDEDDSKFMIFIQVKRVNVDQWR